MELSLLVFLPLLAMVPTLALPAGSARTLNLIGLATAGIQLALTLWLAIAGPATLLVHAGWFSLELGSLGVLRADYTLQLDGLNILMVLLTPLIMGIATLASTGMTQQPRLYYALLLLLNTSLMGCFLSQDLLVFYIFFEFVLLPMYFLISIWGGARREYAAIKFFLYTLAGSLFLLVVMAGLAFSYHDPLATAIHAGLLPEGSTALEQARQLLAATPVAPQMQVHTFGLAQLCDPANLLPGSMFGGLDARLWGFVGVFLAFAIKLPVVPLHTWLPDAHVEASTPISVILAGVLLKMGGYGLLRIGAGIFPEAFLQLAPWLVGTAVVSVLYGAILALAQRNLKRLIAYSSVAHMGYVLLGITALEPTAINGALLQMFNHGVIAAMLFLLAGVLHHRTGDYYIDHYRGLWQRMPRYSFFVSLAFFAGLGLPGLSAFVSEALVFAGAFRAAGPNFPLWLAALAVGGIFLSAAYFLWTLQRMFFGTWNTYGGDDWTAKLTDLTTLEVAALSPLAILTVLLGIMPGLALNLQEAGIADFVQEAAAHAAHWLH